MHKEEGRAHETKEWTKEVQKKYECTCHVYGQIHKGDFKGLMIKTVRDMQETEEPSDRSLPEQNRPRPTAKRRSQERRMHQPTDQETGVNERPQTKSQRGRGKERNYV